MTANVDNVCVCSTAMNLFQSFLVLLLILVEAAPPTASSVLTFAEADRGGGLGV